ncbi:MAG: response regulator [Endomicrobium sp.]|nr:response regulator [Endomicrobium sp.]
MKKKVLIVDDEAAFADSVAEILKIKNYDVIVAANAEASFEALASETPNIVLLDVNLPDKNGFEVLRIIKASRDFRRIPVVLITGDIAVHVDRAFSEGADDCIFKPVDMDKLVYTINRLLK